LKEILQYDIIALIVMSIITVLVLISNLRLRIKNKKVAYKMIQEALDKAIIIEKMTEQLSENKIASVEQSDGFLKFISESRDWAFQYIEEVQSALKKFDDEVSPKLEYIKTYGTAVPHPLSEVIKHIDDSYSELKRIMPND
jgi:predicted unusual protein kinase regulating ubiquinone biosynthesis (AarF/ABC1/UbiB family)